MIERVRPIIDPEIRTLCTRPYCGHPKGCPNYDKKEGCPPKTPMLWSVLDLYRAAYVIYNVFDFREHVKRMRKLHPKCSDRQCKCCLYWQGTARKRLKQVIKAELTCSSYLSKLIVVHTPEAYGVNVTETMKQVGIILEWPPRNMTYQVVLAGTKKEILEFTPMMRADSLQVIFVENPEFHAPDGSIIRLKHYGIQVEFDAINFNSMMISQIADRAYGYILYKLKKFREKEHAKV